MEGFINPSTPVGVPVLMAIAILAWILFLIQIAWTIKLKGVLAPFNMWGTILITVAIGATIGTTVLWDWAPRQAASRISTAYGWQLLQAASAETVKLGNVALANAGVQKQSVVEPSTPPQVSVSSVGQPTTVQTVSTVTSYVSFTEQPVSMVGDALTIYYDDGSARIVTKVEVSNPTACAWDTSEYDPATGKPKYLRACPAPQSGKFLVSEVTIPTSMPAPPPMPAAPSTPSLEDTTKADVEFKKAQGLCWLKWAGKVNLRSLTERLGANALPAGTLWNVTGPGGFLDTGSWPGVADEIWHLSSTELGIPDYVINGYLGRSFPGANDSGTIVVTGTGPMCIEVAP